MFYLGFDTSCYTTSVAAVDEKLNIVYDGRIVLKVNEGERGLRQSDAVFQHSNNIALLIEEMFNAVDSEMVKGICASSKPRNVAESYMPVFTVGFNTAKIIAKTLKQPLFETSHQQNHITAGLWSSKAGFSDKYIVYHLSGGTSEMLLVSNNMTDISIIGGSNDLKAGQFIDRVGVALGFGFPCGQHMDNLCRQYDNTIDIPVSCDDTYMSFSGPESHVQRLINNKAEASAAAGISRGVFLCIAKSIEKTLLKAIERHNTANILIVGGVGANSIIRQYINNSIKLQMIKADVVFAQAKYSSDNAVGSAIIGRHAVNDNMGEKR